MTQIIGRDGVATKVDLSLDHYKAAFDAGQTLPQFINSTYDTDPEKYGTAYEQACASNGLFMSANNTYGIKPPTMAQVLDGKVDINMGAAITRNTGEDRFGVSGRLLFPSMIMELVSSNLLTDNSQYEGVFNRLIADTVSVDSPRYDQPIVTLTDTGGIRGERSMPISQNAEPRSLVSISLSERSFKLPVHSIGLSITDEALKSTTIDMVSFALKNQAVGERIAIIDEFLLRLSTGDVDTNMSALPSTASSNAKYGGTGVNSYATFTHEAYIRYLRQDWKKLSIDWVICTLSGYLAIEKRLGRPTYFNDEPSQARLNSIITAANPGLPTSINYFIVEPEVMGGEGSIIGLDSSRALQKIVFAGAQYSALENFVLRKSTSMRFDWSESYQKKLPNDEAFRKMTFA